MPRTSRCVRATVVALAFAAASCTGSTTDEGTPLATPPAGAGWPHDFEAPLVGGGTIDIGDYEGQDLVLWFWAPW